MIKICKIGKIIQDIALHPRPIPFLVRKFGFDWWKRKYLKNNGRYKEKIRQQKEKLEKCFIKCFKKELEEARTNSKKENIKKKGEKIAFCFWYQGEEEMPELVKQCYESIKKYGSAKRVVLLTKNNISQYVILDDLFYRRLLKKESSITVLSDILRMKLLSQYNAIWMDLTLLFVRKLPDRFYEAECISVKSKAGILDGIKNSAIYPDYAYGNIFFVGGGEQLAWIFLFVYFFYYQYLSHFHYVYYYFMTYFALDYIYKTEKKFQEIVSSMEENNGFCERLLPICNETSEKGTPSLILSPNTYFYKLNRHMKISTGKGKTNFEVISDLSHINNS